MYVCVCVRACVRACMCAYVRACIRAMHEFSLYFNNHKEICIFKYLTSYTKRMLLNGIHVFI